ncbi:MAG: CCA tRNA nucleotidyltransferase [Gemmatimonadales bacterium]|nr:MAG: CCA tRNA nucleotidyltransferase [Gemmatimonadales bacterium]
MIRLDPPGAVRWIARTLEEAGYETWAVGGAVRDALLDRASSDWDLATRARPEVMRRLFRRTVPIGIEHGTVGILDRQGSMYEVTTFRRDVETTGRHAVVSFADTLEEDLARRDFTINAVAWHPLEARLFDPFEGASDLDRRVLRTVGTPGDRFAEDYLRVLRALRFAGRFRLTVDPETWSALCAAVPKMGRLSAERVREELEKVLSGSEPPSSALGLYAGSGALDFLYPEVDRLVGTRRVSGGREAPVAIGPPPEGAEAADRWGATLRAVDLLAGSPWELRMAALLHAVGVPAAGALDPDPASPDASEGERATLRALAIMTRLRASNARIGRVAAWVGGCADPPAPEDDPAAWRRWLARVGREDAPGALRLWAALHRAYRMTGPSAPPGSGDPGRAATFLRRLRGELRSGSPLSEKELAISGRDLIRMGYRPGPEFGVVFRRLLDAVIEDPERNDPDRLIEDARRMLDEIGGES